MFFKFAVNHHPKVYFLFTKPKTYTTKCAPVQAIKQSFTVTILDSAHKIGRLSALLLKQCPLISELRLHDNDNSICLVAEDLSHIDTKTKIKSYCGISVLKNAVTDADIIITLGGCRQKISECSKDLFEKNLDSMKSAALHCIEFNPKAILCIAKPPVEAFVPMVSEEFKKAGVYDHRKIIGISSEACMRANYYVSLISGQNASEVRCPVIGGQSRNCLVACSSQSRPEKVHPQHHRIIQDAIAISEDEVLKLYGEKSTICLSPALAISRFVNAQLKALSGLSNCVDCAFVKQTGHLGQFLPYMTAIVRLGRHGVFSCHMPKVNGYEAHCLKKASMYIKENIKLGESFVTGEKSTAKKVINVAKQ